MVVSGPSRPSGENRHVDNSGRDAVLRSASHVFMKRGYEGTALDDIANHMDSTKGRIYHYFRSKADLFLAIHLAAMESAIGTVEPIAASSESANARLSEMVRAHAQLIVRDFSFQKVAVQAVDRPLPIQASNAQRETSEHIYAMRRRYEKFFRDVLDEGILDGSFREMHSGICAKAILGSLNWMTIWYRPPADHHEFDKAETLIVDEIVQFCMLAVHQDTRLR